MEQIVSASFSKGESSSRDQAITSFILGIFDILAWILPIIGIPVSIVGLILGILGIRSSKKWMAVSGIIICSIFLVASVINVILGALNSADLTDKVLK